MTSETSETGRSGLAALLGRLRSPDERGRLVLIIMMLGYLGFVVALLARGSFAFFPKEVVLPVLLVPPILSRQLKRFVHDWCTFLALIVLFDYLRGLVFRINVFAERQPYAEYVIAIDRALLGGETMPVLLQRLFFDGIGTFERFLTIIHASHFAVLFVVGIVIWYWRRSEFRRFALAMLALVFIGLLIYFLIPTVPPWMASTYFRLIPEVTPFHRQVYNTALPYIAAGFDTNPVAAMPSLHAAVPTLLTCVAIRHFRIRGLTVALYTFFVYLSILYSAEHYLIDVLAGVTLALIVYVAFYRGPLDRVFRPLDLEPKLFRARLVLTALIVAIAVMSARAQRQLNEMWEDELRGTREAIADLLEAGHAAHAAGDYSKAIEVLEMIPTERHSLGSLGLLADSLLELDRDEEVEALFERVSRAKPGAADLIIVVKTAAFYRHERIDRAGVEDAIQRLEAMPGSRARGAARNLREMLERQTE